MLQLVSGLIKGQSMCSGTYTHIYIVAKDEYDLEGKVVGTVAVGRIGERVLRRLKAFDCKELLYYDYQVLFIYFTMHFMRGNVLT